MRRLWGRANSVTLQKAPRGLAYARIEAGGARGVVSDAAHTVRRRRACSPDRSARALSAEVDAGSA